MTYCDMFAESSFLVETRDKGVKLRGKSYLLKVTQLRRHRTDPKLATSGCDHPLGTYCGQLGCFGLSQFSQQSHEEGVISSFHVVKLRPRCEGIHPRSHS